MTVLAVWLRTVIILTFAEALWSHVWRPDRIRRTLAQASAPWPTGLAMCVAALDAAVMILLVLDGRSGAAAAVLYLTVATLGLAGAVWRGKRIDDCGCGIQERAVDQGFVWRNLILIVAAFATLELPEPTHLTPEVIVAVAAGIAHKLTEAVIPRLMRASRFGEAVDAVTPAESGHQP